MEGFQRVVHGIAKGMGMMSALVLFAMMTVTSLDVVGRYFGHLSGYIRHGGIEGVRFLPWSRNVPVSG